MATTYTREDERSRLLTNSVTNGIPSQSSLNHSTSTFKFRSSWQFLGLRVLLRILSFWCPRSSCWLERVLYPFLVNSLLNLVSVIVLLQIINLYQFDYEILGGQKQYAIVYIILSVVASCSHIAGIFYFGSRDVEDNMTNLILDGQLPEISRKQFVFYNIRLALSLLIIPLLVLVAYILFRFILGKSIIIIIVAHLYSLGMYLALLWMIDLLQLTSNIRLNDQYKNVISWTQGVEEGINYHVANYSKKVELSCHRLRIWFFVHNGFLIIALPAFVFSDTKLLAYQPGPLIFFGVAVLLLVIWAIPLYCAEQIQNNDEIFRCNMNNICPFTLNATRNETAVQINTANSGNNNGNNDDNLTFASRSELNLMVVYLQNIKSGFLSVGFTFQLRFSQISTLVSLLTLVIHSLKT